MIEHPAADTAAVVTEDGLRRRALLVAVSDGGAGQLTVQYAIDRVASVLQDRFGFGIERCTDDRATRQGILDALARWVAGCRADNVDVCVLYYFGHAGRVRFVDFPAVSDEVLGYVTCWRVHATEAPGQMPFEGVLGCELSAALSKLADPGRSVVAILDCCFSGQLVREAQSVETVQATSAPAWVRKFFAKSHPELALESHPNIVRLAGSTPKCESYARSVKRGEIGRMTEALLETIEEFGDSPTGLGWDAVARRVRQRVIDEVGEGQWVSFAGPRERLLFSTGDAVIPRTVGFVVDPEGSHHAWLRVGALQGVELGDRWAVTNPLVEAGQLAVGRVVQVELNRARVAFEQGVDVEGLRSSAAELVAVERRVSVDVNDESIREQLRASPWLRAEGPAAWAIRMSDSGISVEDLRGTWPTLYLPACFNLGRAVELLEDRARSERLLSALSTLASESGGRCLDGLPVAWSWGLVDGDGDLGASRASICTDDRLWFRFELRSARAQHWFIHVIYIDAAGRAWQLNTRVPHGIELERGDQEWLGARPGVARAGLGLPWTVGLEHPRSGRAKLVLLATTLPLELEHLVCSVDGSTADAYAMHGVRRRRVSGSRGRARRLPDPVHRWAVEVVDLGVHLDGQGCSPEDREP